MNRRSLFVPLLAIAALPTALLSTGCGHNGPAGTWVVAVDRSGSTANPAERRRLMDLFDTATSRARAGGGPVDLWAFDHDAVHIAGPARLAGSTIPYKVALVDGAAQARKGTLPGRLIEKLGSDRALTEAARKPGPLRVVVLTDGGIDDPADAARLRTACARLAGNHPDARLLVLGVRPELRPAWDAAGTAFRHYRCATDVEAELAMREFAAPAR